MQLIGYCVGYCCILYLDISSTKLNIYSPSKLPVEDVNHDIGELELITLYLDPLPGTMLGYGCK